MPQGQRAYSSRLVCPGGDTPTFERSGNLGRGVYTTITDAYQVKCNGQASVTIVIDMYHDWVENRPVPGFTIKAQNGLGRTT